MLGLLGDEWTLLVIQQALMGAHPLRRFPVAPADLALGVVESASVADRRRVAGTSAAYQTNPPRAEYLTTARSRSLWPMLVSIWNWERLWVPEHAGRPARHAPRRLRRGLRSAVDLPLVR